MKRRSRTDKLKCSSTWILLVHVTGFPLLRHIGIGRVLAVVPVLLLLPVSMVAPQGGVRRPAVVALIGRSVLARPPPIRIEIVPRRQIAVYFRACLIVYFTKFYVFVAVFCVCLILNDRKKQTT